MTVSLVYWQFGPNWPGRRCGAKTRRGTACLKPALKTNRRCQLHGGRGGAPSGEKNGNYKHGRRTKKAIAAHQNSMARVRELERMARELGVL